MFTRTVKKNLYLISIDFFFFVSFRIDAEIAYGKSLRKNSDAYQKLAGRAKG
jgi:hypothetical protein